jgi:hypothetical protein
MSERIHEYDGWDHPCVNCGSEEPGSRVFGCCEKCNAEGDETETEGEGDAEE